MNENNDIFCVINSAGSINCETKEDFFFNSKFDVIFQNIINERKINVKYLSFNSTKIFSNSLDNYALSKKELDNNFENKKMFYSLYIDLVFEDNSQHFKTIFAKTRCKGILNEHGSDCTVKGTNPHVKILEVDLKRRNALVLFKNN